MENEKKAFVNYSCSDLVDERIMYRNYYTSQRSNGSE